MVKWTADVRGMVLTSMDNSDLIFHSSCWNDPFNFRFFSNFSSSFCLPVSSIYDDDDDDDDDDVYTRVYLNYER